MLSLIASRCTLFLGLLCSASLAAEAAAEPADGAAVPARQAAIDAALRFLQRHQSPDGLWDVDAYQEQCRDAGPKAEPGRAYTRGAGDIACTALALLSYFRAGHLPSEEGPYAAVIDQGLRWLLATQDDRGAFGKRNYEHGMATWALVVAYDACRDRSLKKPIAGAIKTLLARQAQHGKQPLGWDYVKPNPNRNDTSVTQWNLLALSAAADAGLRVERVLQQTGAYVLAACRAARQEQGDWIFPYTWASESGRVSTHAGALSGSGLLCAVLTGLDPEDEAVVGLTETAIAMTREDLSLPPCDGYHLLPVLLACEGRPVPGGVELVAAAQAQLIDGQVEQDGCLHGSWDERGLAGGRKVAEVGRLLLTTLATLCLTVEPAVED